MNGGGEGKEVALLKPPVGTVDSSNGAYNRLASTLGAERLRCLR